MTKPEPFLFSPGGRFREAQDGGLLVPMHLDSAGRVDEFLQFWREDGVMFAVVPLRETLPERKGMSPANKVHANLIPCPQFAEFLECEPGQEHEAVKEQFHLATLSDLTEQQYADLSRDFVRWRRIASSSSSKPPAPARAGGSSSEVRP